MWVAGFWGLRLLWIAWCKRLRLLWVARFLGLGFLWVARFLGLGFLWVARFLVLGLGFLWVARFLGLGLLGVARFRWLSAKCLLLWRLPLRRVGGLGWRFVRGLLWRTVRLLGRLPLGGPVTRLCRRLWRGTVKSSGLWLGRPVGRRLHLLISGVAGGARLVTLLVLAVVGAGALGPWRREVARLLGRRRVPCGLGWRRITLRVPGWLWGRVALLALGRSWVSCRLCVWWRRWRRLGLLISWLLLGRGISGGLLCG